MALNGWFRGQSVGSGQYTDRLAAALAAIDDLAVDIVAPDRRSAFGKLVFEQAGFPMASRGANVAHVPYWAPPLVPRVPTVVTVHDLIPLVLADYRTRLGVRAYTAIVARATRRASAVIADSAHTAADIQRHLDVPTERIHVVPLGVDTAFQPAGDTGAVRAAYDLPVRYGLYLGGFDPRKDVATLLAAWRLVYEATGVTLILAGRLPTPNDTLSRSPADAARAVGLADSAYRCLGAVSESDKPGLYAGAAVFAFPSRYEGFGLPPLEAMACGVPVVAADATSLPEVVGAAGLLVPPGDVAALASALRRVLEDELLAQRLAVMGPARAAHFTWARTARETAAIYRQIAA